MRRSGFAFVLALLWATPTWAEAEPGRRGLAGVSDHPRPGTIAALARAADGREAWLRAKRIGGSEDSVRVGQEIAFEFVSDRDAQLTIVHVDGEGNLTLLLPGEGSQPIAAGAPVRLPPEDAFGVVLPIGPESVFAFATPVPLSLAQLGIEELQSGHGAVDPTLGPDFAECLKTHLDREGAPIAAARLDYTVRAEDTTLPYTEASVTEYFSTVTRSYQRPTLNLLIHFESGSSELGSEARARLDEVGKALSGSQIGTYSFALNGHTDDVGDEDYNLELSRRRADAAKRYLVSEYGVESTRLEAVGHGEARPKLGGATRAARDENRRVELELTGRGTRNVGMASHRCGS